MLPILCAENTSKFPLSITLAKTLCQLRNLNQLYAKLDPERVTVISQCGVLTQ